MRHERGEVWGCGLAKHAEQFGDAFMERRWMFMVLAQIDSAVFPTPAMLHLYIELTLISKYQVVISLVQVEVQTLHKLLGYVWEPLKAASIATHS